MKMLRVVLVASNFLEAPNGGNQRPPARVSLRERCDCRDINPHAAPNDSRAVALRTREHLAEPIVSSPNCNIVVHSEGIGSAKFTKPLQAGADQPDQPLRPPQRGCEAILTVEYRKEAPPFAAGASLGRRQQTKPIRGTSVYRNSHTLFKKHT